MLIAAGCIVLRFNQRQRSDRLWWDDWAILGAFAMAIPAYVAGIFADLPSYGAAGYHMDL